MEQAIKKAIEGGWNDVKAKILKEFRELQCGGSGETGDGFYLLDDETPLVSYKRLQENLGISKARLQIEVKEMRDAGLLELTPAVDHEYYAPCGSGYVLTDKGVLLIIHLAEGKDAELFFKDLINNK